MSRELLLLSEGELFLGIMMDSLFRCPSVLLQMFPSKTEVPLLSLKTTFSLVSQVVSKETSLSALLVSSTEGKEAVEVRSCRVAVEVVSLDPSDSGSISSVVADSLPDVVMLLSDNAQVIEVVVLMSLVLLLLVFRKAMTPMTLIPPFFSRCLKCLFSRNH